MKKVSRNKVVWIVETALEVIVSARVVTFDDSCYLFKCIPIYTYFLTWEKGRDIIRQTENSERYQNLKSSFWNNTKTRRTIDYKKESEEARRYFASLRDS